MSSFAHDNVMMSLKCHSRQALDEDIRRLIFTCDRIEFCHRLITRSELRYSMNTCVDVLGARIRATPFDEKDTCIVILRYESRRSLLISQKLHDLPEIHAIERALRHAIEFALSAANGGHGLTLRRPSYHCSSEHDSPSADTPAIISSSMICIRAGRELIRTHFHPN